jgi:hypothetical protein
MQGNHEPTVSGRQDIVSIYILRPSLASRQECTRRADGLVFLNTSHLMVCTATRLIVPFHRELRVVPDGESWVGVRGAAMRYWSMLIYIVDNIRSP